MYGLCAVIFFLDWERLSASTHFSVVPLAMHCLFSGGGVAVVLALYCAARRALPEVLLAAAAWPVEVMLSYVLFSAGFGYWLFMKGSLTAMSFLIVRRRR
jgi:hypothetical protein